MENIKNKGITLEIEGKTIEEAVKKAAEALKVSPDQLKIKILSEEQKGLFGMAGAKPAKVRVSLKPAAVAKKKA